MGYRCSKCGRFMKRVTEGLGLPLSTGFPPDNPLIGGTIPYAPFVCYNHQFGTVFPDKTSIDFGSVEYKPITLEPLIKEG